MSILGIPSWILLKAAEDPQLCDVVPCPVLSVRRLELGELFFDVSLLLWCCVLVYLTQQGLCSAYVPMLMVAFPVATKLLLSGHFRHRGASLSYALLYLLGLALPYAHLMFLIWVVFEIFTPIMGRSGTEIPPDVVLASLVTLATILLSTFLMHLIYLARSTKRVLAALGTVFVVMLVLVSCGLFFPYSADPTSPRPKRVIIQHTTRTFHALDGSVERMDSGLWINSFDYTGMSHVTPHIPEINDTIRTRCPDDLPFCGFPWFLPVKFLVKKNWYLPAPTVSPKSQIEFRLVSKQVTEWGSVKLSFEAKGKFERKPYSAVFIRAPPSVWILERLLFRPSHMSLYLLPQTGASLTGWSFGDGTPQFDLNGEYFIFYSRGLDAPAWTFWLEVQSEGKDESKVWTAGGVDPGVSDPFLFSLPLRLCLCPKPPSEPADEKGILALAISSHYFFGEDRWTPPLEALIKKFPDWAFTSSWVSMYRMRLSTKATLLAQTGPGRKAGPERSADRSGDEPVCFRNTIHKLIRDFVKEMDGDQRGNDIRSGAPRFTLLVLVTVEIQEKTQITRKLNPGIWY
ncbi:hypothetical protein NFI96_002870 [Prochilodus magdalenae]|nr:hypothetical protein NFI96_002870 [Prochilodus magdalenae]